MVINSINNKNSLDAAYNKAIELLTRREHSQGELRNKLFRRGFAINEVNTVIENLANQGLQNDERFLESFVASRAARGQGPLKIAAELRSRGITQEQLLTVIDYHDPQWQNSACKVRQRRFGTLPKDYQKRMAQARFLAQRGFTSDQIKAALSISLLLE